MYRYIKTARESIKSKIQIDFGTKSGIENLKSLLNSAFLGLLALGAGTYFYLTSDEKPKTPDPSESKEPGLKAPTPQILPTASPAPVIYPPLRPGWDIPGSSAKIGYASNNWRKALREKATQPIQKNPCRKL